MKNLFLSVGLLLGFQVYAQVEVNTKSQFSIVFYNVENLFDTIDNPNKRDEEFTPTSEKQYTYERYQKKLVNLSTVISNITSNKSLPDLVGLCEIENKQVVEDLASTKLLSKGKYEVVHYESPDSRGIDNALMYNKKRFAVICDQVLPVQIAEYSSRDILYVCGRTSFGDTLHLFVNHWPSRRGGQEKSEKNRVAAAEVLKQKIDELTTNLNNPKIVVMGDFNDYPINKSIEKVIGATSSKENGEFVNLMYEMHVEEGVGTYNYRGEWGCLDQFLVSNALFNSTSGLDANLENTGIFRSAFMMYKSKSGPVPSRTYGGKNYYGGYSDHLPIYLVLEMK